MFTCLVFLIMCFVLFWVPHQRYDANVAVTDTDFNLDFIANLISLLIDSLTSDLIDICVFVCASSVFVLPGPSVSVLFSAD